MNVPPDSPLWKNSSSLTSVGFGMVGDEDDLDVAVLRGDELVEQEEEGAREILLHRVHRSRRIHDADHDGVRLAFLFGNDVAIGQVVVVEREALVLDVFAVLPTSGELAAKLRAHGPSLVETNADADRSVALALG